VVAAAAVAQVHDALTARAQQPSKPQMLGPAQVLAFHELLVAVVQVGRAALGFGPAVRNRARALQDRGRRIHQRPFIGGGSAASGTRLVAPGYVPDYEEQNMRGAYLPPVSTTARQQARS